jgi:(E)-4-hydroxy-3-methylbut-2-enyl-diphosphate synthase
LAEEVEKFIQTMKSPLKVAVMGCAVNGPGEAREADIGVAGGRGVGIIFKKGELFKTVSEDELLAVFMEELQKMEQEWRKPL